VRSAETAAGGGRVGGAMEAGRRAGERRAGGDWRRSGRDARARCSPVVRVVFLPGHNRGFGLAKVLLTPYQTTLGPPPMLAMHLD
jgi:hypothetical protein